MFTSIFYFVEIVAVTQLQLDTWLVLETRLILETRLLLEVLRYNRLVVVWLCLMCRRTMAVYSCRQNSE